MFKFQRLIWLAVAIIFVWLVFQAIVSLYPTFLWFDNLGFASVFWINFRATALTGLFFGLLFFIIAAVNVFIALRLSGSGRAAGGRGVVELRNKIMELFGEEPAEGGETIDVTPRPEAQKWTLIFWGLGILLVSIFMGISAATQWPVVLKALNAVSFGITDPIFNKDIGFYVFNFPLQDLASSFIFTALLLSLFAVLWLYFINHRFYFNNFKLTFAPKVKAHLAIILALLTLVFAWMLWLGELQVLYSSRGVVFGAGYTDVKAQLLGYNTQILVLFVLAVLLIVNIFQEGFRWPIIGFAAYFIIALVMGGFYPGFVQNFRVKPNEIALEAPYIEHNIKFTRLAYGLNNVEEKEFAATQDLTLADLRRNSRTVGNIRLLDPRPLLKTYRQLQGIRLYYDFSDVDVDRYYINGRYQQVMLASRELRIDKLPAKAQTWVNQRLKFTHGYGLCLSPVNRQTADGQPELLVKDIPPVTQTNLKIGRPEIYYGEETQNYVIVNSAEKEFDYPKGDQNVYTSYSGKGGVAVNSLMRRLAFSIKFSDLKLLLTRSITPQSRIMFDRAIKTRVSKIAPFLAYDRDPYMVIDQGKLYWIQDAFTYSDRFPYSDPTRTIHGDLNYIRNSVKVVIDAYNGSVEFYAIDEQDPIVKTYQKIYPQLFKTLAEMPEGLKQHLRYPYDLYMIQAHKYATYHMTDPQVFYNQEDLWNMPKEIYAGSEQPMMAYNIIMRVPGEKKEEFLLMLPFTPNNKDNMIAWLAGRSDMPNYGKLLVYKFPKDKLIYGPMQIEARIDQQTEISEQFTLWGQGGSRVIRGNLLAIPIEDSIIYVEPVYLEAATGELPELKRVITVYGNNVVMAETLNEALSAVFSGRVTPRVRYERPKALGTKELAKKALEFYNQAQSSLKQGDFGSFGERLIELKKILQDLAK